MELICRTRTGVQLNGKGPILDHNGIDGLVPLLRASGLGCPEREAEGVDSIRNGSSIGFGEPSLEVHQLRNRRYLSQRAYREQRQQSYDIGENPA